MAAAGGRNLARRFVLGEGRWGEVWTEDELYEKWRNADEADTCELEAELYSAFKRHAQIVVFLKSLYYQSDLAHDIAVDAIRGLPRFEGRSELSTWVHGIAVRSAMTS